MRQSSKRKQSDDSSLKSNTKMLIHDRRTKDKDTLIGILEVVPREQQQLLLGVYTHTKGPKGFVIELDPDPEESVVAEIMPIEINNHYKLVLQVANFGDSTIIAKVWQLGAIP